MSWYPEVSSPSSYFNAQAGTAWSGNTIYFAGVDSTGRLVYWTYQFGASVTSTETSLSGSTLIRPDHGWHVSISVSPGTIAIFYGADEDIFYIVSTDGGNTWNVPQRISNSEDIVNGLVSYYSGSDYAVAWVNKFGDLFAVRFAKL
jgi:Neuraminidase (sialidase)